MGESVEGVSKMQRKILQVKEELCWWCITVKGVGWVCASLCLCQHTVPLLSSHYIETPHANPAKINHFTCGKHNTLI